MRLDGRMLGLRLPETEVRVPIPEVARVDMQKHSEEVINSHSLLCIPQLAGYSHSSDYASHNVRVAGFVPALTGSDRF